MSDLTEERLDAIIASEFQTCDLEVESISAEGVARHGAERLKRELIRLGFASDDDGTICSWGCWDSCLYCKKNRAPLCDHKTPSGVLFTEYLFDGCNFCPLCGFDLTYSPYNTEGGEK